MYENDTSVVTMYLTVSKEIHLKNTLSYMEGNLNYSVYDYEYGSEDIRWQGLLQVGDENGRAQEVGYEACLMQLFRSEARHPARMHKNYKIELKKNKRNVEGRRQ